MTLPIVDGSFHAVLNKQPGPGQHPSFYATVEVEVEVDWDVKLVSAVPQGFNPLVKLLRFDVHKPTGKHSDAVGRRTLRYDEGPAQADYTDATIENGDDTVGVVVMVAE